MLDCFFTACQSTVFTIRSEIVIGDLSFEVGFTTISGGVGETGLFFLKTTENLGNLTFFLCSFFFKYFFYS